MLGFFFINFAVTGAKNIVLLPRTSSEVRYELIKVLLCVKILNHATQARKIIQQRLPHNFTKTEETAEKHSSQSS